jgi:CelD/BcsL family acetyltransferase involved in cellulose biosynthesis
VTAPQWNTGIGPLNEILEINDIDQLSLYQDDWQSLLATTSGADFFRTLDWLQVYWRHYGQGQQLRTLIVRDGAATIGILPLVVKQYHTRLGNHRVLTYPLADWGSFYGPIGVNPRQILERGLQHLHASHRDWDFIELRWVNDVADEWAYTSPAMKGARFEPRRRAHTEIPILDMNRTWDDYWASLRSDWRRTCRRNEKKLARCGNISYVRHRPSGVEMGDADPRWDLYDQCEQIARISWQGQSEDGTTLSHENVRPFLRDMHLAAARAGGLDLNLLYVDGVPVAFHYNYCYRGHLSSLRLGYDPQFRDQGAGTVLAYQMLEDSFELRDHTFDFLPGSLGAKKPWRPEVKTSYRYSCFPSHRGRLGLLNLKHRFMDEPAEESAPLVFADSDSAN